MQIALCKSLLRLAFSLLLGTAVAVQVEAASDKGSEAESKDTPKPTATPHFKPESITSTGTVTLAGSPIEYQAVAGTIVVHPKGWDDAALAGDKQSKKSEESEDSEQEPNDHKNPTAEASMFYVTYNKKNVEPDKRPVTFLFNGGPGSSTVWLHMGAFGPKRVITADDTHTAAAPYQIVNNDYSLLDASDLVFIDAPGTGFSRIAGKNKEKEFYGVDADAHAFAEFIVAYLSKYGRWNSPKYIFGE
ncbi:MAG TPA: hypothetical protein VGQ43_04800, partial [Candidatus Udaeobacter sp.]|nr:hypothetical protein [Candidatus Udaeobacter sp.]